MGELVALGRRASGPWRRRSACTALLPSAPPPEGWPSAAEVKAQQRTADQIQRNDEYSDILDKLFFR